MSWRSDDVYFFLLNEVDASQEVPRLASPYLNVKIRGQCGSLSGASSFPDQALARNPLLFSLGVVLLEIAYCANLMSLQRPTDAENGLTSGYTEFFAARRLAKVARNDMGKKYHEVVERLIECDFGCGDDLNNPLLQAAFHNQVISPLEELEKKLHEITI